jgi:hypothetical protein
LLTRVELLADAIEMRLHRADRNPEGEPNLLVAVPVSDEERDLQLTGG